MAGAVARRVGAQGTRAQGSGVHGTRAQGEGPKGSGPQGKGAGNIPPLRRNSCFRLGAGVAAAVKESGGKRDAQDRGDFAGDHFGLIVSPTPPAKEMERNGYYEVDI